MKTLLLVIDVQKTFINENTEFVASKIQSLIGASLYDIVAFTRFLNTENSKFIRELDFRGAIGEDKELVLPSGEHKVFDKEIYTCYNLEFQNFVKENQIDKIYLYRLINKIEIDKDKNIYIYFNFSKLNSINENLNEFIKVEEVIKQDVYKIS